MVDLRRVRAVNTFAPADGAVVYWMQRDQRSVDNWALLYAQQRAEERAVPLHVVFNLVESFGHASYRQFAFMLRGLEEVAVDLEKHNISFSVCVGSPAETIPDFMTKVSAGELVLDFNPLSLPRQWKEAVIARLRVQVTEVDAHNIVPCWQASDKEEFAAYTFRPKVQKVLREYLTDFPPLKKHPYGVVATGKINWNGLRSSVSANRNVQEVVWCVPGMKAAMGAQQEFIINRLEQYATDRNDPNKDGQSNLSPYIHFGQLSAQRLAYAVNEAYEYAKDSRDAFLEELVVRRELADNYCYYSKNPDTVNGAHVWAQQTLAAHATDTREYLYSKNQFERAATHDELWNAMQQQLVKTGKLHGWCRMYWAKKILEWTRSAKEAVSIALYLNDTYSLDGNDPNGIVGVMWSICGVHDRAWSERPIFGKIRYMNFAGAKRKFKVAEYIARWHTDDSLFS